MRTPTIRLRPLVPLAALITLALTLENDWRKATVLKRRVPGIKEEDLDRFRTWPVEGDEILE
ncbi:MAG: hypothetical protein AAB074_11610 [Planctomycetota bacterium]